MFTRQHVTTPKDRSREIAMTTAANWQPIETAPKDRNIIITGRYGNGVAYVEESYWCYRGHWNRRQHEAPTHWMPMPEPFGGWGSPS